MARPSTATPVERAIPRGVRLFTGLVMLCLVVPIVAVFPLSFTAGQLLVFPLPGWSLQWYEDFFTSDLWTGALLNSLVIGVAATVLATMLGTSAALGLHGSAFRAKPWIVGLLCAPLAVPVVITAVASFYFLATLNLVGTYAGLILVHTVLALPFVVITVTATLQGFDHNLVRAAASLGAPPGHAFRTVTLPLILPGVLSGAVFAFVTSFDELVVALFLASPTQRTLPRQIFSGVSETISPTIVVAAVMLAGVSMALMAFMEWLRRRGERLRTGSPTK